MILVSILGLASSIANIYIYMSSRTSTRFGTDLRGELFAKIQQLSFSDIDRFSPASLITRLTNDISKIQQIVLMCLRMLLRSPLMMIMALFFITTIDGHLALILLAVIPIVGVTIYFLLKKGLPLFIKVQERVDQLNAVVRENLINIKVVKSFVREDYESGKFVRSSD
ncbi:MAG: ABC transporter ATP-binding protein [Odoribacter sp.]|nr:ABC transporter ATP-binding protein [Odoribacter sp.]